QAAGAFRIDRRGRSRSLLMRCAIRQSAQAAASLFSETNGAFTAAQFRDRVGSGRQLPIHILNYLDGRGVTQRRGETRRLTKDRHLALGDGGLSWYHASW